jgi:hypothetical protein
MLERPNRMALVGLTANGHPDLGFGRDGLAIGPRLRRAEEPEAVIGDERGGIIVAGSLRTSDDFGFDSRGVIRRFARDGTLDRSFGRDGLVRGALEGGGYTVIEQRLAFLDGETLVAAEDSFDGKYGFCCGATLRTLNAGYDTDDPSISLVAGCHRMRVSITDLSGMGKVVVRAGGHVIRRTDRKRFGVRLRPNVRRISVRATDLAGNTSTRKLLRPRC